MGNHQVKAIYGARVSHVQGDEKTSHLDQHDTGGKYCTNAGWDVVGTFEDLDVSAISTSPWERPDLGPWLSERSHEWDALVVTKTDRLFRSAKDSVDLAHWAEKNRKILVLVDDGIKLDFYHSQDEQDPWSVMLAKIFLLLSAIFAEMEGRRFVQRAQSRVRFLRTTDRWGYGIPPYGFVSVDHPSGKGKALAHDPEMQSVLHEYGHKRLVEPDEDGNDRSLTEIVSSMNDEGVLTARDLRRVRRGEQPNGEQWTVNQYVRVMSSSATQGIKMSNGKPILNDKGQPIRVGPSSFKQDEWDQIQRKLAERSTGPQERRHNLNPLLGVGSCGNCEKSLRQQTQTTPAGKVHRYYWCGNSPKQCPAVSIIASDAEALVEQTFLEQVGDLPVLRRIFQPGEDHSYELDEVNATIDALREDRALGLFSTAEDQEIYRGQMRALIARREDLESKPYRPSGWVYEETEQIYSDAWAAAGPEQRRKLLVDAGVRFVLNSKTNWEVKVPGDIHGRLRAAQ